MTFYDRYVMIAEQHGIDPCSQEIADAFGITRATISSWKTKGTRPKGETVAVMADRLGVSADYLLGRTEDPTDYAKKGIPHEQPQPNAQQAQAQTPVLDIRSANFLALFNRLDAEDKIKAQGVIQGMLMQDKYAAGGVTLPNAAHARTDIQPTSAMVDHDENIMNDPEF